MQVAVVCVSIHILVMGHHNSADYETESEKKAAVKLYKIKITKEILYGIL